MTLEVDLWIPGGVAYQSLRIAGLPYTLSQDSMTVVGFSSRPSTIKQFYFLYSETRYRAGKAEVLPTAGIMGILRDLEGSQLEVVASD